MVLHTSTSIQVRPVRPADAELLPAFFEALSERTLYRRYSSPLRTLSTQLADQVLRLPPQQGVSLVAVQRRSMRDRRLVGLAQLFGREGAKAAEGALVVADHYHGRGLGSALIEALVQAAKKRHTATIWGLVQHDNHAMLGLARNRGYPVVNGDLGFEVHVPVRP